MKGKNKSVWICGLFLLVFLCSPLQVFAKTTWRLEGDAAASGTTITLTKSAAQLSGGLFCNTPIDMRNHFVLSFQYRVGDRVDSPREGFMLIFGNSPLKIGDYGSSLGYNDYIFGESSFYGIEFDTYANSYSDVSGQHIAVVKNSGTSRTHLDYANASIADNNWHDVLITYSKGVLSVAQDQKVVLSSNNFSPSAMSYFGFSASTFLYAFGYQSHTIQNIILSATEASHIVLNGNGGFCPVSSLYTLKDTPVSLPEPSRYGYLFDGWYTSASGGGKISGNYPYDGEKTLYAHWKNNMYTVSFKPCSGKVSPASKTIIRKSKIGTLPTPKRKNYTFDGWYTKKKGGQKISYKTVPAGNVSYYAHWISNHKKVKLKLNAAKGKCGKSTLTVTYGGKLKGLPKATRKGYNFLGWYTKKSAGTKVTASTKTTAVLPKKTLYAHWKKKSSGSSSSGGSGDSSSGGGSNKVQLPCVICKGSGRCQTCGGTGYLYSSASKKYDRNCYKCNASGNCFTCGGTGLR